MPNTSVTIASGAATSSVAKIYGYTVVGIHIGTALTGATCTFTAAPTVDGSYQQVKDSAGNAVSIAANAAGFIGMSGEEADAIAACPFLKLVSASNEAADRTVTLVLK